MFSSSEVSVDGMMTIVALPNLQGIPHEMEIYFEYDNHVQTAGDFLRQPP
jgi:hypothetical protein